MDMFHGCISTVAYLICDHGVRCLALDAQRTARNPLGRERAGRKYLGGSELNAGEVARWQAIACRETLTRETFVELANDAATGRARWLHLRRPPLQQDRIRRSRRPRRTKPDWPRWPNGAKSTIFNLLVVY
eukprot:466900-Prorocentrum_minimum.AAC.3